MVEGAGCGGAAPPMPRPPGAGRSLDPGGRPAWGARRAGLSGPIRNIMRTRRAAPAPLLEPVHPSNTVREADSAQSAKKPMQYRAAWPGIMFFQWVASDLRAAFPVCNPVSARIKWTKCQKDKLTKRRHPAFPRRLGSPGARPARPFREPVPPGAPSNTRGPGALWPLAGGYRGVRSTPRGHRRGYRGVRSTPRGHRRAYRALRNTPPGQVAPDIGRSPRHPSPPSPQPGYAPPCSATRLRDRLACPGSPPGDRQSRRPGGEHA